MVKKEKAGEREPEVVAFGVVYQALKGLKQEAQIRVISHVTQMLNLARITPDGGGAEYTEIPPTAIPSVAPATRDTEVSGDSGGEDLEGISPVAKKWMKRNGLTTKQLSPIFSLGVDEIDLIAKNVPGKGKRARMRSVFLLKGVAAYLSSGVARFTHEQAKEACLHYDAYDKANFATFLKGLSAEVSGSKDAGHQLTPRGLTSATEIISGLAPQAKTD